MTTKKWLTRVCRACIRLILIGCLSSSTTWAQTTNDNPNQPQTQVFLPLVTNGSEGNGAQANTQATVVLENPSNGSTTQQTTVDASAVAPTIRLNGAMTPLFGILPNINHGWITDRCGFVQGQTAPTTCGNAKPYRAWIDGPMNPYRYGGNTYFQIPHSENYRIKIPGNNWGDRTTWTMEGDTLPSARDATESLYNNRHWLFSVRNVNGTLYGLTHHEWYMDRLTVGGVPGFLASNWWIASIGWAQSTNGGASWQMKPTSDGSRRLVIVPQPSGSTSVRTTYGFAHPSNIVWDAKSAKYYAFFTAMNHSATGQAALGVVLFRTGNIAQPTGWEFWNGTGWTVVNHNTYQGNFGPQMPYVFWKDTTGCSHLYAMNVRHHKYSGKWILLGSKWCTAQAPNWEATFSWTIDLAKPTDLEKNLSTVINPPGQSIIGRPYYSFFDTDGSADDNYQEIGNNPLLVSVARDYNVAEDQGRYYHQFLTLTGF
jgi:hypothetical protein